MVKRTQTMNCLSAFDHFVGLVFKGFSNKEIFEIDFINDIYGYIKWVLKKPATYFLLPL